MGPFELESRDSLSYLAINYSFSSGVLKVYLDKTGKRDTSSSVHSNVVNIYINPKKATSTGEKGARKSHNFPK